MTSERGQGTHCVRCSFSLTSGLWEVAGQKEACPLWRQVGFAQEWLTGRGRGRGWG